LDEGVLYAKERKLLEEIQSSLGRGRKVHVFAVYTRTRDVTRRLERILQREGIRVAVLTSDVKPEVREAWYERQSRQGVQVVISHPKLVSLGLDLLEYKDLIFWETGYSLYTLRQASRRSWRIGQTDEVTVKYFAYARTAQETCLRLMGRKLLVAMGMEGKFSAEGLQAAGEDDDLLMAMARELVTEKGIGENAELVWRAIQHQNSAVAHAVPVIIEADSEHASPPDTLLPAQEPLPATVNQLLLFGASLAASSGRKRAARRTAPSASFVADQPTLF
ncbi:MAG: C-terminal helicase domain-containing protein, partial [Terriglobia bacterium]